MVENGSLIKFGHENYLPNFDEMKFNHKRYILLVFNLLNQNYKTKIWIFLNKGAKFRNENSPN